MRQKDPPPSQHAGMYQQPHFKNNFFRENGRIDEQIKYKYMHAISKYSNDVKLGRKDIPTC